MDVYSLNRISELLEELMDESSLLIGNISKEAGHERIYFYFLEEKFFTKQNQNPLKRLLVRQKRVQS